MIGYKLFGNNGLHLGRENGYIPRQTQALTSFNTPAKIFRFDNRTSGKIHPTQKPVELYIEFVGGHIQGELAL